MGLSIIGSLTSHLVLNLNQVKTTQFRGLNLCEYKKGEKHIVILFRIKSQRDRLRVFTLGKFDNNLNVITGETKFGIKQIQERLHTIAKEHQDKYEHWIKDPNLTVASRNQIFDKLYKITNLNNSH